MPKRAYVGGLIAVEGDRAPRKIQRAAIEGGHDLDVVRIERVAFLGKRAGRGDHFELGIILESLHEAIDEAGIDGGLVSLHVDDVLHAAESSGDLGKAVVARKVWVEGEPEPMDAVDFGPDRFEWNDRREVVEQPLFFFFFRDKDGRWKPIGELPRIGGTGPPFARRPGPAPGTSTSL